MGLFDFWKKEKLESTPQPEENLSPTPELTEEELEEVRAGVHYPEASEMGGTPVPEVETHEHNYTPEPEPVVIPQFPNPKDYATSHGPEPLFTPDPSTYTTKAHAPEVPLEPGELTEEELQKYNNFGSMESPEYEESHRSR